jgi:hypothetical protein
MQFKKIHFFLLLLLNIFLPEALVMVGSRHNYYDYSNLLWIALTVIVVSFIFFFIFWFLYYVITGGKDPSLKFHLLSQCLTTLLIISFYGLVIYYNRPSSHYEDNISHNKFFLEPAGDGIPTEYDTLYRKGFALLEEKMNSKSDIRLARRVKKSVSNTITGNTNEQVCVYYFTYTLKGRNGEFASKHITGSYTNKLLFYDVPLSSLPELQALIDDSKTSIEESLSPGTAEKTYREFHDPADSSKK